MADTSLKYTTPSAIALRLRGRLELNETIHGTAFGQNLGAKQVQFELYEQVASQVEAKLDMGLGMMYELPVPQEASEARKILASIVEKFTVAEILSVHYQQSQNPQMGGDMGYGAVLLKQAKEECQAIGIDLPGLTAGVNPLLPRREVMVLPGVPKKGDIPDVITRNYSVTVQRNPDAANQIQF